MLTPHAYQEAAIQHLLNVLPERGAGIDGSDTGTGKTLVSVEVMRRLGLPTLVVCPKAVRPGWERTAAAQGTDLNTLNYERVRMGNTEFGEWRNADPAHHARWFRWHPAIKLLIFDEGHRCKGYQTQNSLMLKAARRQKIPTLVLSATLADTPMEMDALGHLLKLHDSDYPPTVRTPNPRHFLDWAHDYGVSGTPPLFNGNPHYMAALNKVLYPNCGVRVKISELGDAFPETQITAELYDIDEPEKMAELSAIMAGALELLAGRTSHYDFANPMSELAAARQQAELLMVPTLVDRTKDSIAQGASVVIFVNYRLTLEEVCRRLGTTCKIDGSQVGEKGAREREANRVRFQADDERVIVCTDAGAVGIDLHDITGKHQRHVYNLPGFNAKIEKQKMGRVWRSGARSKSLQRFMFPSGVGEGVHASVSRKLNNLDALNDGILDLTDEDLQPRNLRFDHG